MPPSPPLSNFGPGSPLVVYALNMQFQNTQNDQVQQNQNHYHYQGQAHPHALLHHYGQTFFPEQTNLLHFPGPAPQPLQPALGYTGNSTGYVQQPQQQNIPFHVYRAHHYGLRHGLVAIARPGDLAVVTTINGCTYRGITVRIAHELITQLTIGMVAIAIEKVANYTVLERLEDRVQNPGREARVSREPPESRYLTSDGRQRIENWMAAHERAGGNEDGSGRRRRRRNRNRVKDVQRGGPEDYGEEKELTGTTPKDIGDEVELVSTPGPSTQTKLHLAPEANQWPEVERDGSIPREALIAEVSQHEEQGAASPGRPLDEGVTSRPSNEILGKETGEPPGEFLSSQPPPTKNQWRQAKLRIKRQEARRKKSEANNMKASRGSSDSTERKGPLTSMPVDVSEALVQHNSVQKTLIQDSSAPQASNPGASIPNSPSMETTEASGTMSPAPRNTDPSSIESSEVRQRLEDVTKTLQERLQLIRLGKYQDPETAAQPEEVENHTIESTPLEMAQTGGNGNKPPVIIQRENPIDGHGQTGRQRRAARRRERQRENTAKGAPTQAGANRTTSLQLRVQHAGTQRASGVERHWTKALENDVAREIERKQLQQFERLQIAGIPIPPAYNPRQSVLLANFYTPIYDASQDDEPIYRSSALAKKEGRRPEPLIVHSTPPGTLPFEWPTERFMRLGRERIRNSTDEDTRSRITASVRPKSAGRVLGEDDTTLTSFFGLVIDQAPEEDQSSSPPVARSDNLTTFLGVVMDQLPEPDEMSSSMADNRAQTLELEDASDGSSRTLEGNTDQDNMDTAPNDANEPAGGLAASRWSSSANSNQVIQAAPAAPNASQHDPISAQEQDEAEILPSPAKARPKPILVIKQTSLNPTIREEHRQLAGDISTRDTFVAANLRYDLSEERLKELFAAYESSSTDPDSGSIPRLMIERLRTWNKSRLGSDLRFEVFAWDGELTEGRVMAANLAIHIPDVRKKFDELSMRVMEQAQTGSSRGGRGEQVFTLLQRHFSVVRWSERDIVVAGDGPEITVTPPYGPENAYKGRSKNVKKIQKVRKVLREAMAMGQVGKGEIGSLGRGG